MKYFRLDKKHLGKLTSYIFKYLKRKKNLVSVPGKTKIVIADISEEGSPVEHGTVVFRFLDGKATIVHGDTKVEVFLKGVHICVDHKNYVEWTVHKVRSAAMRSLNFSEPIAGVRNKLRRRILKNPALFEALSSVSSFPVDPTSSAPP